jgi:hypothetical protein
MRGDENMKYDLLSRVAMAAIILLAQLHVGAPAHPASRSDVSVMQGITTTSSCPEVSVNINFMNITPATPAQQHVVNMTWGATAPSCFSLKEFKVKGAVTFANGETRIFEGGFMPNQFGAHIPVTGVPNTRPRKVTVKVAAIASAPITGSGVFPAPALTLTTCTSITALVTQASMIALVPAPNRPGQDFHPKVKVDWQTPNLGACQRINQFTVEGELKFKGKGAKFSRVVSGDQRSAEFTLTSIAVGAGFTPDEITAKVTAAGEAKISGGAQKEIQVN